MRESLISAEMISFAAACDAAATLDELESIWREHLVEMGFTFVALGVHADPLRPDRAAYVFQNYPDEWIAHFSTQRYHLVDPVYRAAEAGTVEFAWTDPEFLQPLSWRQRRILNEAREFGLRHGRTHGLASMLPRRASASLVTSDPDMPEGAYTAGKLINVLVHHRATQMCIAEAPRFAELKRRERQCLELCASGLVDADIARGLGLSVATVRRHIERARVRLGASTRIQAAARAIASGQIKPIS
ncbi:MAG: LuxR family transcriptional regulator [Terricaulis sp.]|nr:LuxR family transcriptional regulator [Terricaulis sp.]